MDFQTRCCIARVRVLALRAQISAGGDPRPGQVRRAFAPIAAELVASGEAATEAGDAVVNESVEPRKVRRRRSRVKRIFA